VEGLLRPGADVLIVVDREPGKFLFATWRNVSILVWTAQVEAGAVLRLRVALARLMQLYPNGRSCVTVACSGLILRKDYEARSPLIELMRRSATQLACLGILAEATGFERSALLGFHTNLRIASNGSCEMAFLNGVEDLAAWMPERHAKTGVELDPYRLADVVRQAIEEAKAT
jgi:hypothetical protein